MSQSRECTYLTARLRAYIISIESSLQLPDSQLVLHFKLFSCLSSNDDDGMFQSAILSTDFESFF